MLYITSYTTNLNSQCSKNSLMNSVTVYNSDTGEECTRTVNYDKNGGYNYIKLNSKKYRIIMSAYGNQAILQEVNGRKISFGNQ